MGCPWDVPWEGHGLPGGRAMDHLDLHLGGGTGQYEKKAHFGDATKLMRGIANI